MTILVDVDGFRAAAKDGTRPDCAVMRATAGNPEAVGERTVRFVFSDETVDRMGDSVKAAGWQLDDFVKNAVALWCHDSSAPPIGRASNVHVSKGKLIGDIEFMPAEISDFADSIFRMVKGGFLNAVSVGFLPLEYSFVKDADRPFGIDFKKQQLLEISVCSVPANPNALIDAHAKGINIAPVVGWAEKVLANGGNVIVPRDFLEETFRAAKTPRTVRQKYLAKTAEPSDWQMGAADDLPVAVVADWDGAAAARRMLSAAGFDGDQPDVTKAQRGFLVHDAANPTLRSSYKLPFADIIDDELMAVSSGIEAAAARLEQAGVAKSVLNEAQTVIEAYQAQYPDATTEADQAAATPAVEDKTATPAAVVGKAGRRHSAATVAALEAAKSAIASAHQHIEGLLANDPDDDGDGNGNDPDNDGDKTVAAVQSGDKGTPAVQVIELSEDPRAVRLREVQALKDSLKH